MFEQLDDMIRISTAVSETLRNKAMKRCELCTLEQATNDVRCLYDQLLLGA